MCEINNQIFIYMVFLENINLISKKSVIDYYQYILLKMYKLIIKNLVLYTLKFFLVEAGPVRFIP